MSKEDRAVHRLPNPLRDEIVAEIDRATELHGEQDNLPDSVWLAIATEEVGEVAEGVLKEGWGKGDTEHTDEEIVQVIAVMTHWLMIRRARVGARRKPS